MLTLASGSPTRRTLLENARVAFEVVPARIDEPAVREALSAEGIGSRDMADALAELKALNVRRPGLVLGSDQILEHNGTHLSKPADAADAKRQLAAMSDNGHKLHIAAVICEDGRPVWRYATSVTMTMRSLSLRYIDGYVTRNWEDIRHSAGSYTVEGEGARLFRKIDGDYFAVLGLPLLPVLDYLITRGELDA